MVNSNLNQFRKNNARAAKHSYTGAGESTAKKVKNIAQSTKVETVTGEVLTLIGASIGDTGKVRLKYDAISDSIGGKTGYYIDATNNDTSIVVTHLALAGGMVKFDENETDTEIYASLKNGEYKVDHANGILYYKKGTTDVGGTIDYLYTSQEIDLSTTSISIGDVTSNSQNISTEATSLLIATDLAAIKVLNTTIAGDTTSIDTTLTNVLGTDDAVAPSNNLNVGAVYNATDLSLDDGDNASLQLNDKGQLKVTGGASSVSAEYTSPSDFTATYTSSTTITLSAVRFTITDSSQIVYIKYIPSGGSDSAIIVNGSNGATITVSSNVLTVNGAGTPFASGDVYEVGINAKTKGYNISLDLQKVAEQKPLPFYYTAPEEVQAATDIGTTDDTWVDAGSEISMNGYNTLTVYGVYTKNDSAGGQIQMLSKHESGGSDEYIGIDTDQYQYTIPDANTKFKFVYKTSNGTPYVQIQTKATTVGATEGTIAIKIVKSWSVE